MWDLGASSGRDASDTDLAAEISAAARCAALLEDADLRLAFRRGVRGQIEIELRRASGERLRSLTTTELFELLELDVAEQAAWADSAALDAAPFAP